jgi:hypothetical protein
LCCSCVDGAASGTMASGGSVQIVPLAPCNLTGREGLFGLGLCCDAVLPVAVAGRPSMAALQAASLGCVAPSGAPTAVCAGLIGAACEGEIARLRSRAGAIEPAGA